MTWVTWSEKQLTRNAEIDNDHKKIVALINQLADSMENNEPREFCSEMLEQFIELTRAHFLAEELLMEQQRYPQATQHKALHAMLLKDVAACKESYDAGNTAEVLTLLVVLDTWLERDIMAADMALADFIAAAGSSLTNLQGSTHALA